MTDQDIILQVYGGRVFLLDTPPHLLPRVTPGRRVRVAYEDDRLIGEDARMRTLSVLGIDLVTVQPPPSFRSTTSGRRSMVVDASGSAPAPSSTTTAPASTLTPMRAMSYSSQMLLPSYYTDQSVRGANVSTLFMIVDICGQRPSITRAVGSWALRIDAWEWLVMRLVMHPPCMRWFVERIAWPPMLYLEAHSLAERTALRAAYKERLYVIHERQAVAPSYRYCKTAGTASLD